jgi:hypothetical protein
MRTVNPWIYVTAVATAGMVVFGLLWLRTQSELHEAQNRRDDLWDEQHGIRQRSEP